jgi:hypothetical protein
MTTKEATETKKAKATKSGKKGATTAPVLAPETEVGHTLADLSAAYLAALEAKGTSIMTRASYQADLGVALKTLGETTKVSAITARKVQNFFESDVVVKTRTGKAKAMPTILKTRRVLRLALVWANEAGWIAEAPIPEAYQRQRRVKKAK